MIVDYMLWRWTFRLVWGPQLVEIRVFVPRCRKTALQQHAGGLAPVRGWEERVFLQTSELELKARRSILLPSEQRVFFLSVWGSFRSLVHRRLLLRRSSCLLTRLSWGECFRIGWPSGTNSVQGDLEFQNNDLSKRILFPSPDPPLLHTVLSLSSEGHSTDLRVSSHWRLGLWVFRLITSNELN